MIKAVTSLARGLGRLRRRQNGNATIEFVILFPVFMTLFVSSFELGILMTRQVMLERAVDLTVRDLRLGKWPTITADILKTSICEDAEIIPDCDNVLMLEMLPVQKPAWNLPNPAATCVDRSAAVQPVVTFQDGPENEMMMIRACVMIDPFFPGTGLALKMQENVGDGFALVSTSAFVYEPGAGLGG